MNKKTHLVIIISFLFSNIFLYPMFISDGMGNITSDASIELLDSDSWSRIINEDSRGNFYRPYFEYHNNSLYIFGVFNDWQIHNSFLFVSKYNSSGVKEWEFTMEVPTVAEYIYTFDTSDNLYLVIFTLEAYVLKLNSSGGLIFIKNLYNEINIDYFWPKSIVLGENNSFFVFGSSWGTSTILVKLSYNGDLLWNQSLNLVSRDVKIDSFDNLYVTYRNGLAKYNSSGKLIWSLELEEFPYRFNLEHDFIYLILYDFHKKAIIQKYSLNGSLLKNLVFDNYPTDFDIASRLYKGNTFLIDESNNLTRYDQNLNLRWNLSLSQYSLSFFNIRYHPYYYSNFVAQFVAQDSSNCTYLLQRKDGNVVVLKVNESGDFISLINWGGEYNDIPIEIKVDDGNNIFILLNYEYFDLWGRNYNYLVIVKNPKNGDLPLIPKAEFNFNDYVLFSTMGIVSVISIISLISIITKKNRIKPIR